jgi:hypothetical protein
MITLADPCSSSRADDVHLTAKSRVPAGYLTIRFAASITSYYLGTRPRQVPAKHTDCVADIEPHCCSTVSDTSNQAPHFRNHGLSRRFRKVLNRERKTRLHWRREFTTFLQPESLHNLIDIGSHFCDFARAHLHDVMICDDQPDARRGTTSTKRSVVDAQLRLDNKDPEKNKNTERT